MTPASVKKQVRAFLRIAEYYPKLLLSFDIIVAPLLYLTKRVHQSEIELRGKDSFSRAEGIIV